MPAKLDPQQPYPRSEPDGDESADEPLRLVREIRVALYEIGAQAYFRRARCRSRTRADGWNLKNETA